MFFSIQTSQAPTTGGMLDVQDEIHAPQNEIHLKKGVFVYTLEPISDENLKSYDCYGDNKFKYISNIGYTENKKAALAYAQERI